MITVNPSVARSATLSTPSSLALPRIPSLLQRSLLLLFSMFSSRLLVAASLALLALVCLSAAPTAADHCYNTCCSLGWRAYGYGNFTKRAPATTNDSNCNCLGEAVR